MREYAFHEVRSLLRNGIVLMLLSVLAACVAPPTKVAATKTESPSLALAGPENYTSPCAEASLAVFECDRRSILTMVGEFRVRFAFEETAVLAPGCAPHAPQHSGGTELVLVIDDRGDHISLQHILVLGKEHTVVKHWRQDWQYQPQQLLRFRGNRRFASETVSAENARGSWLQTVYEVDDAPRYTGIGRWQHANGVDARESDRTWRPLPRREYTKRTDYQALDVINRHTLTPGRWVHEQDNTKLVLQADGSVQAIVREHGINSYTRIIDYDFSAGRDYWKHTQNYWAQVRAEWIRGFAAHANIVLKPDPDGERRIDELFALAERAGKGETITREAIADVLGRYGLLVN